MIKKVLKSILTVALAIIVGVGACFAAGATNKNASYAASKKPANFKPYNLWVATGGLQGIKLPKVDKIIFTNKIPKYAKNYKLYPKIKFTNHGTQINYQKAKKGVKYKIYVDNYQKGRIVAWSKGKTFYFAGNNRSIRFYGPAFKFDKNGYPHMLVGELAGISEIYSGKLKLIKMNKVEFSSGGAFKLFLGSKVDTIDLRGSKFNNVKTASNMFSHSTVKKIIFPKKWTMHPNASFDVPDKLGEDLGEIFRGMFEGCKNLKTVDLSGYYGNINNVYKMLETFSTKVTAKIPGNKTVVYDGKNNKVMKEYQTKK